MKKGMALGLFVMAVGTFVFGTYATHRNYPISLVGLFIIGSGLSLLQTASNPYISILGPIESAAQRISFMGICNKVAGMLAPVVVSFLVLDGVDKLEDTVKTAPSEAAREAILNEFAAKIYMPYMVMAVILVILSFWIIKSALPEIKASEVSASQNDSSLSSNKTSILEFPHLLLGALCIFVYVGVEVMAGDATGTLMAKASVCLPVRPSSSHRSRWVPCWLGVWLACFTIPRIIKQQFALP